MKNLKSSLLFCLLALQPIAAHAVVNEISFDFGYDRQKYGRERQNSNITRVYSGGLATYIFDYTAIDINAARSEDVTTENERYTVQTGLDLVGSQNRVTSHVYGIGLKQMFAPRTARLIPGISIGYAKQFINYQSDLTVLNTTTSARTTITSGVTKQRIDSVFGTFSVQLKMTERLSLKGSVRTLFKAVEFNQARDNLKYSLGFSWIF